MIKLSRYYSMTSLIGIVVVIICLSVFIRFLSMQMLMLQQAQANTDLANSFANSMWKEFSTYVESSYSLSADEIHQHPKIDSLIDLTRQQIQGMNVVKIKLYNMEGLTIFSTDPSQIGEDRSQNEGYLQARSGEVVSEITFRNQFYAFEQTIVDRNLVASYIPIRESKDGPIKAILEVYSDVTPLVENMDTSQDKIMGGIFSFLALLYIFLFFIVRRADNIITEHEAERKINEEHMRYQAYHDSLTGLANRDHFVERIDEVLSRARRYNRQGAMMFIDLDRFKVINDSLGHDAGDQLLGIAASRISKAMRDTDMAFRMGGDEFIILVEELEKLEDATKIAQRILDEMVDPVLLNGHEVNINLSIGITGFPKEGDDMETLVREADTAMYRAKEIGHNRYEFYTDDMNIAAFERFTLERDLQRAITHGEFVLHYQPKVYADSHRLSGLEALIRWQHPEKGLIMPDVFIPILEETGLINDVGEWVIMQASMQAQKWVDAGHAPVRMSVNISARQFRSQNLSKIIANALAVSGMEPKYLELELTESMFFENSAFAIKVMHELKDLGISLAIDDFGAGYSSLSYLKQFPVDYLKIDRSFVKDISRDDKDAAITTAISSLARSLNLGIIAEGVEEEGQVSLLRDQGCQELQGFLFSCALSAEELEAHFFVPIDKDEEEK